MTLGRFELTDITPQERGEAKVEVVFDIDANGIIHVSATDLQTDTSRRIRVEAASGPAPEAVDRMLAESRRRMEGDRRKREEIEAAIRAENFLRAAEQLLGEAARAEGDEAVLRAAEAAEKGASAVREALAAGEAGRIAASGQALEACLKTLSKAIKAAAACVGAHGQGVAGR
jgi:molecular chaperone DnaK